MDVRILGLLLLLSVQCAIAVRIPSPECKNWQCGNVTIQYPFGIGEKCALERSFSVCCELKDGIYKPFIGGGLQLLNISLTHSTIRVLANITTSCYNSNSGEMEVVGNDDSKWFDLSDFPAYRFSDVDNKFTVIGCNTFAYFGSESRQGKLQHASGCISTCQDFSDSDLSVDDPCSGMGCCQTAIPKGVNSYEVDFGNVDDVNTSFSHCSHAMLMETEGFKFKTEYINSTNSIETRAMRVPVVIDWAIRNGGTSREITKCNEKETSACLSSNSECLNSTNGPGYICKCSKGYDGNPYVTNGCIDIDECSQSPCPSSGICHNIEGGYRCSCRAGRKYSWQSNKCNPDAGLIIGITIGLLASVTFSFSGRYMILEKRKLKNIKQEHFRQHGGLLLFERMKSEKGLSFTIFTESELIQATDNYDKSRIIGKGGHGTVYKGIVKDNTHVAIKRCALIDERQKKEFGQEMLILSQVNHKNIVKLVGACLEVEVPMLVYEFIPNGTLYELIHGKKQALQITFSTLLKIVHEAAEGLNFLHSYASPPILHGDVKTANILLDENYTAKVSDFGASILVPSDEDQYVTVVQGTCGYLDPEYMKTFQLTDKSDVYSFGVILLEVLTGQMPLKFDGPEKERSLSITFLSAMKDNSLDSLLPRHIKGRENTELIKGLAELAQQCLDMCGSNRPTMKEIVDELSRLRRLPLHPWAQIDAKLESQGLLEGTSTAGSNEIELSTSMYNMQEDENLPMNPNSSYYRR